MDPGPASLENQTWFICAYAIDGQYGFLPRVLYYSLIVFALLGRDIWWLIAGALAAVTTYAGSAAIHGMAFAISGAPSGELDSLPLMLIISSGCLAVSPMLNWSATIRKFRTRSILLWWNLLLVVAYYAIFFSPQGGTGFELPSALSPSSLGPDCDLSWFPDFESSLSSTSITQSFNESFLARYNCTNPCYAQTASVLFRDPSTAFLLNVESLFIDEGAAETIFQQAVFPMQEFFTMGVCPFQGAYIFVSGGASPRQARNALFRFIVNRRFWKWWRPLRSVAVVTGAILAVVLYICAVVTMVLVPPVFILNIVSGELYLTAYPESDPLYGVGQWSPWASIALALLAAVLNRYWPSRAFRPVRWLKRGWQKLFYSRRAQPTSAPKPTPPTSVPPFSSSPRVSASVSPPGLERANIPTLKTFSVPETLDLGTKRRRPSGKPYSISHLARSCIDAVRRVCRLIVADAKDFGNFVGDPVETANQPEPKSRPDDGQSELGLHLTHARTMERRRSF